MGVFGVIVYLYYWISFFLNTVKKNIPELSRFCFLLIFINMFAKTLFSMSMDTMTFIHGMMIGLAYYGFFNTKNIRK